MWSVNRILLFFWFREVSLKQFFPGFSSFSSQIFGIFDKFSKLNTPKAHGELRKIIKYGKKNLRTNGEKPCSISDVGFWVRKAPIFRYLTHHYSDPRSYIHLPNCTQALIHLRWTHLTLQFAAVLYVYTLCQEINHIYSFSKTMTFTARCN